MTKIIVALFIAGLISLPAQAQDRHDCLFTASLAAFTVGTVADVVTTHAAIASGYGQEGNPLMQQGSAVRIGAAAGMGVLLVKLHRTHPKAATVAGFALSSLYLSVAAHNAQITGRR